MTNHLDIRERPAVSSDPDDPIALAFEPMRHENLPDSLLPRIQLAVTEEHAEAQSWPARWLFAIPLLQLGILHVRHVNVLDWAETFMRIKPLLLARLLPPARAMTSSGIQWLLTTSRNLPWPEPRGTLSILAVTTGAMAAVAAVLALSSEENHG